MAYLTIQKRVTADGTPRWRCAVSVKEKGEYVYRESKTFIRLALAKSWGRKRVEQLELHGIPSDAPTASGTTLRSLMQRYLSDPELGGKAGRNKKYVLRMLLDYDIASLPLAALSVSAVIDHCRARKVAGAGPATISHDISYLAAVLSSAKPVYGLNYTDNPAKDARDTLLRMGLIGKSSRRSRRPQRSELQQIEAALRKRSEHIAASIPYVDILNFSILSCMRIGEVCKIRWADLNEAQRAVLVLDRKDPRKKEGNHMWVPLLGDAWHIVQRQPRTDDPRIFPFNSRSISTGFQQVRNELGIEDLRYHDLRREGASRLFESGFSIEEVAQVTGHRSLNVLWQVYTELYPNSLHAKFDALTSNKP
ncbi:MAG: site-specific integrase [Aeromonas sp.]